MDEDIRNTADILDQEGVERETIEQTLTRMLDERDAAKSEQARKEAERAAAEEAKRKQEKAVDDYFNSLFPQRR